MKHIVIDGTPEQGTSYLFQVDSDTKLIEKVSDHLAPKTEGNIEQVRRLENFKRP